MRIIQAGACDIGKVRQINQDSVIMLSDKEKRSHLYVVADGMGGHSDGEVASNLITSGFNEWWLNYHPEKFQNNFRQILVSIQNKLAEVNRYIFEKYNNGVVCGSTCILLFIFDGQFGIISAGDSRIYTKRGFHIESVMVDDVWENLRSVQDSLTEKQRKSHSNYGKLINAVGTTEELKLSMKTDLLKKNDTFLLCSDGLYKFCPEKYIKKALRKCTEDSINECVHMLIEKTYQNSAKDNISVILVKNVEK